MRDRDDPSFLHRQHPRELEVAGLGKRRGRLGRPDGPVRHGWRYRMDGHFPQREYRIVSGLPACADQRGRVCSGRVLVRDGVQVPFGRRPGVRGKRRTLLVPRCGGPGRRHLRQWEPLDRDRCSIPGYADQQSSRAQPLVSHGACSCGRQSVVHRGCRWQHHSGDNAVFRRVLLGGRVDPEQRCGLRRCRACRLCERTACCIFMPGRRSGCVQV